MSEHTKEPWFVHEADDSLAVSSATREYMVPICSVSVGVNESFESEQQANARRIIACVNACDGIPTEFLEREQYLGTAAFSLRDQLKQQRDELLTALVEILDAHNGGFLGHGHMDAARAAIAKVKGGKK